MFPLIFQWLCAQEIFCVQHFRNGSHFVRWSDNCLSWRKNAVCAHQILVCAGSTGRAGAHAHMRTAYREHWPAALTIPLDPPLHCRGRLYKTNDY